MADWIISNFPDNYTKLSYVEVFGGGGWVLFKKQPSKFDVINDLNGDLTNLYLTIRDNLDAFKAQLPWFNGRDMFYYFLDKYKRRDFKDNIDRATTYAYVLINSFSINFQSFHSGSKGVHNWRAFINRLDTIKERLLSVIVENLDFRELLEVYAHENSLLYLDPPYVGTEHWYSKGETKRFTKQDHIDLHNKLKNTKSKFLLSYKDDPFIRDLYKDFIIEEKRVTYNSYGVTRTSKRKCKPKATELLIKNFEKHSLLDLLQD